MYAYIMAFELKLHLFETGKKTLYTDLFELKISFCLVEVKCATLG
jgi:hypothetical protein